MRLWTSGGPRKTPQKVVNAVAEVTRSMKSNSAVMKIVSDIMRAVNAAAEVRRSMNIAAEVQEFVNAAADVQGP